MCPQTNKQRNKQNCYSYLPPTSCHSPAVSNGLISGTGVHPLFRDGLKNMQDIFPWQDGTTTRQKENSRKGRIRRTDVNVSQRRERKKGKSWHESQHTTQGSCPDRKSSATPPKKKTHHLSIPYSNPPNTATFPKRIKPP